MNDCIINISICSKNVGIITRSVKKIFKNALMDCKLNTKLEYLKYIYTDNHSF